MALSSIRWIKLGVCSRTPHILAPSLTGLQWGFNEMAHQGWNPQYLTQRRTWIVASMTTTVITCPVPSSNGDSGDTWVRPHRVPAARIYLQIPWSLSSRSCALSSSLTVLFSLSLFKVSPQHAFIFSVSRIERKEETLAPVFLLPYTFPESAVAALHLGLRDAFFCFLVIYMLDYLPAPNRL